MGRPRKEFKMVRYLTLWKWTHQGISKIEETTQRAEDLARMAEGAGARVTQFFWTVGEYDGVFIVEAPDEMTAVAVVAKLAKLGNVRTQTLRAFDAAEMKQVTAKVK
jgi:uncharacterized protein with GYD domain